MEKFAKNINKYYFNLLLKGEKVFYTERCGFIYLSDKYIISIISEKDLLININLLTKVDLCKFIDDINMSNYNSISDWDCIKSIEDKKFTDEILLYNDQCKTHISKKYFRLFYCLPKYNFYITNVDTHPVLVFDDEALIGLILPIKHY